MNLEHCSQPGAAAPARNQTEWSGSESAVETVWFAQLAPSFVEVARLTTYLPEPWALSS
jgi:hypothetical protein